MPASSKSPTTFTPPPLDGTLTLDQIYDWHRVKSQDFPAFVFPRGDQTEDTRTQLTWKDVGEAIIRGKEIAERHMPEIRGESERNTIQAKEDPLVVGILATSNMVIFNTFLFSLMRLTHPNSPGRTVLPFPISTRNSAAAVAHLAKLTGVKYLWITEGPMRTIVNEALNQGGLVNTTILQMPSFWELYPVLPSPVLTSKPDDYDRTPVSPELPALILHSSGKMFCPLETGTTAFPKPRTLAHGVLVEWSRLFDRGELNVEGEILNVHGLPPFHAGGIFTVTWAGASSISRAVPFPGVSLPPPSPEYMLDLIAETNSTLLFCVPSFPEAWSKNPKNFEKLSKVKALMWGSGPMQEDAGRFLHKQGIPIQTAYGSTETGLVYLVANTPYPEGYEWFKLSPHIAYDLIPDSQEERVFELVFKQCDTHHMPADCLNTQVDGIPAYASSDIVERHPTNPDLFKIRGRTDDQIMLSTGEKTNPIPLESIISGNPHVKSAIMFGRGRLSNGVLIEPTSFEEAEKLGLEKFRNLIWSCIQEANTYAPAHSRIFKEMILVASASKPLTYTAKGSPRRGSIIIDYAPEIDEMYRAVQDSVKVEGPLPPGSDGWTLEQSLNIVRNVVKRVMTVAEEIGDDDDLFGLGCDSLQATYIRNSLLHAVRQIASPSKAQNVPSDFVYQQPTIRSLAAYISKISLPGVANGVAAEAEGARIQRVNDMVAKYTQNWPRHSPSKDDPGSSETILLTGSTGGFGSQLLAQLVEIPSVVRIYAFNRPARDGKATRDRHVETFSDRGNDISLLDSDKIVFVNGDTSVEGFGIDAELFREIRDSATTIIHNAWRVDFNIALASFEPAIRGVRYMIDLALRSPRPHPPRVMFTSSVGNVKAWLDIGPIPEGPVTDRSLINTAGYSESKWVSERILAAAGESTALRPVIVRVGQLCGGLNGNWNVREWFPALVRASQVVGGVPDNSGLVSFIPLHLAASALIDLRHTSSDFVHLVHPRPVHWRTIISHVSDVLHVPIIPYNEWLQRLEATHATDEAMHRNPALHLIPFYRVSSPPKGAKNIEQREVMGMPTYETQRTVRDAPSLTPQKLPQLGKEDVGHWIDYWKSKGALDP